MRKLTNLRVAVLVMDGFEESELVDPVRALKEAGATVEILSTERGEIQAFHHHDKAGTVFADGLIEEAQPEAYDGVLLPGGALNADALRMDEKARAFLRAMQDAGKPIAAICHAPWVLISSGLVKDRTLTGYKTIQDDVRNAGGKWVDQEVVVDGNLVTSRQPDDIPAFNQEMLALLSEMTPEATATGVH